MSVLARTGRHKQRYQDHLRLVAGCIPYKIEEDRVLVLMISSPTRADRVFPKGGWENDESLEEAACRESFEEAGVKGLIGEKPIGEWEFRSKNSEKMGKTIGRCKGYMFALQVTQELDHWPGLSSYTRKWMGIEEAFEVCRYEWMRDALKRFMVNLKANKISECCSDANCFLGNSSCNPNPTLMLSSPNLLELS